jgi:hypothetical protein
VADIFLFFSFFTKRAKEKYLRHSRQGLLFCLLRRNPINKKIKKGKAEKKKKKGGN